MVAGSSIATRLETHRWAEYPGSKAVLVAIAIPVFNTQLEKARDAVSLSNLRAAYAQSQAAIVVNSYMKSPTTVAIVEGDTTINTGFNFCTISGTVQVKNIDIKSQKADEWSKLTLENQQDFAMPDDGGVPVDDATVTFTYEDGKITATSYAAAGA